MSAVDVDWSAWQTDLTGFVERGLGESLWSAQREVCAALAAPNARVVVSVVSQRWQDTPSREGSGVAWWMMIWPVGTATAITIANRWRQVTGQIWPAIRQVHATHNLPGRCLKTMWQLGALDRPSAWGMSPGDYDVDALSGFHAPLFSGVGIADSAGVRTQRAARGCAPYEVCAKAERMRPRRPGAIHRVRTTQRRAAQRHFTRIASGYRLVRTTDDAPVRAIVGLLNGPVVGVDIAAGTGRYTDLLVKHLPGSSTLFATDLNYSMLASLAQISESTRTPAIRCNAEALPLPEGSVDFVSTFNAVHHFDLALFVAEAARIVRPVGTSSSTPARGSKTLGRSGADTFLSSRSGRLAYMTASHWKGHCGASEMSVRGPSPTSGEQRQLGWFNKPELTTTRTFALYEPDELEAAIDEFLSNLGDVDEVFWEDQNLLVYATRVTRGSQLGSTAP